MDTISVLSTVYVDFVLENPKTTNTLDVIKTNQDEGLSQSLFGGSKPNTRRNSVQKTPEKKLES